MPCVVIPRWVGHGAGCVVLDCSGRGVGDRGTTDPAVESVSAGWRDLRHAAHAANEPEKLAMAIGMTSLGRLGQPEDLADVVALLAGPDGRWHTGQNIRANGGVL
ncbi:SDR family oxidoreductase [Streptomyces sp. NBC_00012]|uniref:SDR family oxidoreductase n=1 Tax=unclassified Streptomyces TaxID=2593676 RepID=UPI0038666608